MKSSVLLNVLVVFINTFHLAFCNYTCGTPSESSPDYSISDSPVNDQPHASDNIVYGPQPEQKLSRILIDTKYKKWPDGIIYYEKDSIFNPDESKQLSFAFDEYHQKTCIKFQRRTDQENYVSIVRNESTQCAFADVCMLGGVQRAQFTSNCMFNATIVHELGHSLCLSHEQWRNDRDNFVSFEACTTDQKRDAESEKQKRQGKNAHKGIYDYASQMHYSCSCEGKGGVPKTENWKRCGDQIPGNIGLSVMDAEHINEIYGCQGCHRHRWIPIGNIGESDKMDMYSFGHVDVNGTELYPCRALYKGEIAIGMYIDGVNGCRIPSRFDNQSVLVVNNAEILTIPRGLTTCSSEIGNNDFQYKLLNVLGFETAEEIIREAVPAGNGWSLNEKYFARGYIAFASLTWEDFEYTGNSEDPEYRPAMDQIGTMWDWNDRRKLRAVFSTAKGNLVNVTYFKVLVCHGSRDASPDVEEKPGSYYGVGVGTECETGCYPNSDGSCTCSIFEDY